MKQYIFPFEFEGQSYIADATEIAGLDDTQYAVSPRDANLAARFHNVVLRKAADQEKFQFAIPEAGDGLAFMDALAEGLHRFLTGTS